MEDTKMNYELPLLRGFCCTVPGCKKFSPGPAANSFDLHAPARDAGWLTWTDEDGRPTQMEPGTALCPQHRDGEKAVPA